MKWKISRRNKKTRLSEWTDLMCQLRPLVTAEAICCLIPWRYRFLTFLHQNKIVGVGAYFSTAVISDTPYQRTYLVNSVHQLNKQNRENTIQSFIDRYATFNFPFRTSVQLFMSANPDHRLLALQNKTGELEGIVLFELQNRLSVGGNCFYVSDLIVKDGPEKNQRKNLLLLSLIQRAKKYNLHETISPIQSIIVEMAEEEIKHHELLKQHEADDVIERLGSATNINSFFCVTAKHFAKISSEHRAPIGNWYSSLGTS